MALECTNYVMDERYDDLIKIDTSNINRGKEYNFLFLNEEDDKYDAILSLFASEYYGGDLEELVDYYYMFISEAIDKCDYFIPFGRSSRDIKQFSSKYNYKLYEFDNRDNIHCGNLEEHEYEVINSLNINWNSNRLYDIRSKKSKTLLKNNLKFNLGEDQDDCDWEYHGIDFGVNRKYVTCTSDDSEYYPSYIFIKNNRISFILNASTGMVWNDLDIDIDKYKNMNYELRERVLDVFDLNRRKELC